MGRPRTTPLVKTALSKAPRNAATNAGKNNDILLGMEKLRISQDVRSTFSEFKDGHVGLLCVSFYGIVSSSQNSEQLEIPEGSSCRVFYESAFQAIPPLERKSPRTEQASKEMATSQCWERFPSELVSFATIGIASDGNGGAEEPFFVRLLKEDESGAWDVQDTTAIEDPLQQLHESEILHLVTCYLITSPFGFLLNDTLVIESLIDGSYDPALVAVMIAFVLLHDPLANSHSPLATPPFTPPYVGSSTSAALDQIEPVESLEPSPVSNATQSSRTDPTLSPSTFIRYAERLLFARPAEEAASSVSTNQAMMILGIILLAEHKARASWSIMATGLSCVRESLKRIKDRGTEVVRTEKEVVEDEQLVNLWWMFAIYGSWSFLSMDLPRSTLIDVTDSHPLPAFTHDSSLSYQYRLSRSHVAAATPSICSSIRSFNETCRTLSLVITLSIKTGAKASAKMQEMNARLPSQRFAFEYPFVADARLAGLEVWQLFVGKWLLDMAEQHSSTPPPPQSADAAGSPPRNPLGPGPALNSFSTRKIRQSRFLSTVHAIMCLHRLAPFNDPDGKITLSAPALRLAVRAMELVVQESRDQVQAALGTDGQIDPDKAKMGLLRLIGDCLPHCLRIMHFLAEASQTSQEIYALLVERRAAISKLLEDLSILGTCGLRISKTSNPTATATVAGGKIDQPVERDVKRVRSSTESLPLISTDLSQQSAFSLWGGSKLHSAPPLAQNPYTLPSPLPSELSDVTAIPHTRSATSPIDGQTLSLPYPFCFASQLAPTHIVEAGSNISDVGDRPVMERRSTSTGTISKPLAHQSSHEALRSRRPSHSGEFSYDHGLIKPDLGSDLASQGAFANRAFHGLPTGMPSQRSSSLHRVNSLVNLGRQYSPRNLANIPLPSQSPTSFYRHPSPVPLTVSPHHTILDLPGNSPNLLAGSPHSPYLALPRTPLFPDVVLPLHVSPLAVQIPLGEHDYSHSNSRYLTADQIHHDQQQLYQQAYSSTSQPYFHTIPAPFGANQLYLGDPIEVPMDVNPVLPFAYYY